VAPSVLAGCTDRRPHGAPDLDGFWQTVEVIIGGESVPGHRALGHVQRIDKATEIHVIATYEDGVHVLRPHGLDLGTDPIEIRRRRDGEHLVWDYLGFTARLRCLAPSDTDAAAVMAALEDSK